MSGLIHGVKPVDESHLVELPELSEAQKEDLEQRMRAMDLLLAREAKGKYKLELMFGAERPNTQPTPGCLQFFESGSQLHGGGDAKVYVCPGGRLGKNNCWKPIPFTYNAVGHVLCPSCNSTWKRSEAHGEVYGRHTMQNWAKLLYLYLYRLDCNADIVIKHAPNDIRIAASLEQEKQRMGERYEQARTRHVWVYPLKYIIRDVNNGVDLLKRLQKLLME